MPAKVEDSEWIQFQGILRKKCDAENVITLGEFEAIMNQFKICLKKDEVETLISSYPGRDEGMTRKLQLTSLFAVKGKSNDQQIMDGIDLSDEDDAEF